MNKPLLLLPRLRVQNANAIAGPLSYGFPSPTAFLGFADIIERRVADAAFDGCGIICHSHEQQVVDGGYEKQFTSQRHPYTSGWKSKFVDKQSANLQEARMHFEVSLLLEMREELHEDDAEDMIDEIETLIPKLRIAGGLILPQVPRPEIYNPPLSSKEMAKLKRRLMPGFSLVDRSDVLEEHRNGQPAIDALLDLCRLNSYFDGEKWAYRTTPGWFVPTVVGYSALSELYEPGTVKATRDETVPFRFCEALYGLGQWVSPHRFKDPEQMIWRRVPNAYRCTTQSFGG